MLSHPSTPTMRHAPPSALWPSPQFSDYFSGSEDQGCSKSSSATARVDPICATHSPVQSQIIHRLHDIARKVASSGEHGSQTPHLLDFDTELSALESRLNAPDSQTREIAEDVNAGLFSTEDEDAAALEEENEDLRRQVADNKSVVDRITKLTESLQLRYKEMKKNDELATKSLTAANDEIVSLKSENESLRTRNADLHADLNTAIPSIVRLRSQLKAIELQAAPDMDRDSRDQLNEDLARWKKQWQDAERDFDDLAMRYDKKLSLSASSSVSQSMSLSMSSGAHEDMLRNGMSMSSSSSLFETRSASSAKGRRSVVVMRRGGLIRRYNADVTSSDESEHSVLEGEGEGEGEEKGDEMMLIDEGEVQESQTEKAVEELVEEVGEGGENIEDVKDTEGHRDDGSSQSTYQTPWQELWASLAEYAGIHDYYD